MNLVSSALRRPITVLVAIVAIVLGAVLALRQMPRDILPDLGIPIIYVAQPYGGMDPSQMESGLQSGAGASPHHVANARSQRSLESIL